MLEIFLILYILEAHKRVHCQTVKIYGNSTESTLFVLIKTKYISQRTLEMYN